MSASSPIIEDADFISGRLIELAAERSAIFCCTCETLIDTLGREVKRLSEGCPVHSPGAGKTVGYLP